MSPRPNYAGHNGYGSPRGLSTSPRASPRPSPRPNPLATRPSLSDDDVESPPGSDNEDPARDPRVGVAKGSAKKTVSFRDGHDEYRPTGLQRDRLENAGRVGQAQAGVRNRWWYCPLPTWNSGPHTPIIEGREGCTPPVFGKWTRYPSQKCCVVLLGWFFSPMVEARRRWKVFGSRSIEAK